jgi:hypothetical protein
MVSVLVLVHGFLLVIRDIGGLVVSNFNLSMRTTAFLLRDVDVFRTSKD